jgi:hypothetical protein
VPVAIAAIAPKSGTEKKHSIVKWPIDRIERQRRATAGERRSTEKYYVKKTPPPDVSGGGS